MKSPWSDDLRLLQTRRWALALIYYYRSILCYRWVRFVGNLTPTLKNFWDEGLVVWIGHQQKTIPALRSEEQVPVLGVPPGVGRCRQHTPPYVFYFAPALVCSGLGGCEGYRRCRGESGNLSPGGESFRLYSPPQRFDQVRQCMSPLKGAQGERKVFRKGLLNIWVSFFWCAQQCYEENL